MPQHGYCLIFRPELRKSCLIASDEAEPVASQIKVASTLEEAPSKGVREPFAAGSHSIRLLQGADLYSDSAGWRISGSFSSSKPEVPHHGCRLLPEADVWPSRIGRGSTSGLPVTRRKLEKLRIRVQNG
jgi:hypothetical protein